MAFQKSLVVCSLLIVSLLAWGSALGAQAGGDLPIYLDSRQPVAERINDLLSRMTLPEKVGQLNMPVVFVDQLGKDRPLKVEACKRFAEGTYTDDIGPGGGFFALATTILFDDARQQAEYINQLQDIATKKTRLKIPLLLT